MPTVPETARFIVTHPHRYLDRPTLFRHAWAALKDARGESHRIDDLGPPRHGDSTVARVPALVADLDARRERTSDRVRALLARRAAELGLAPRTPDGGGDAA